MLLYEFVCQECANEFELIVSFSSQTMPPCPNCQSTHVLRKMGLPAVHFKGSGWYITDSKNENKRDKSSPASNGKDETKSDAVGEGTAAEKSEKKGESETTTSTNASDSKAGSSNAKSSTKSSATASSST